MSCLGTRIPIGNSSEKSARKWVTIRLRPYERILRDAAIGSGANVLAVSYDNAIAEGLKLSEPLLRHCGMNPGEASEFANGELRINKRHAWESVEAGRLVGGVISDHLGMEQNRVFKYDGTGNQRPITPFKVLPLLPENLVSQLMALIRKNEIAVKITSNESFIENQYRKLCEFGKDKFVNLIDGEIFPPYCESETVCTDLAWQELPSELYDAIATNIDSEEIFFTIKK